MVKTILKAAGLLAWPGRAPNPPAETYAIYFDDVTADGPDGYNFIFTHDVMVELYEPTHDDAAEAAVEAELNARGIPWTKQARYWLDSVRRYQVIYEFSYIEKRRT
jgi:hypothetical protein